MRSRRTVILDCGASRTALGAFSRQGERLRLDEYAVEVWPTTAGGDAYWLESTRAALAGLRRRWQPGGPVVLVLPAHLVLTRFIKTPRVKPAQREKIIRFEAEQSIPFALTDVVWDSAVVAESALEQEVLLAAAKREPIESLCAAVQAAGFEPRRLLPPSLTTLAAFRLMQGTPKEPVLVLNLGARSTTLWQIEGPRLAGRTLAFGGQGISWPPERDDHVALEILATRLAQEITRSGLHFRRQNGMGNPGRVHLTGGGARLTGLGEALAAKLKVPVDRGDVLKVIEVGRGAAGSSAVEQALTLTDLTGAAATQLHPGHPVLNLLPPHLRRHESLRRRQPWLAAAAGLALAALVPPLLHFRTVAAEARLRTDALERELAPWRERDARNRINLQQLAAFQQQIAQLQGIHDRRASWLNLLADLQERLVRVEDVWLERMSIAFAPGAPLKLAVSGRMLDKSNPLAKASPETFDRVKALLASIVDSPFVASVEAERFDIEQPGILKFDCVLVADPARPL